VFSAPASGFFLARAFTAGVRSSGQDVHNYSWPTASWNSTESHRSDNKIRHRFAASRRLSRRLRPLRPAHFGFDTASVSENNHESLRGAFSLWIVEDPRRHSFGALRSADSSGSSEKSGEDPTGRLQIAGVSMTFTTQTQRDLFGGVHQPLSTGGPQLVRLPLKAMLNADDEPKPTRSRNRSRARASDQTKSLAWTSDEHDRFLEGLELFPCGPWKEIALLIGTRTVRQTMTHAQKYRQKIARHKRGLHPERKISFVVPSPALSLPFRSSIDDVSTAGAGCGVNAMLVTSAVDSFTNGAEELQISPLLVCPVLEMPFNRYDPALELHDLPASPQSAPSLPFYQPTTSLSSSVYDSEDQTRPLCGNPISEAMSPIGVDTDTDFDCSTLECLLEVGSQAHWPTQLTTGARTSTNSFAVASSAGFPVLAVDTTRSNSQDAAGGVHCVGVDSTAWRADSVATSRATETHVDPPMPFDEVELSMILDTVYEVFHGGDTTISLWHHDRHSEGEAND